MALNLEGVKFFCFAASYATAAVLYFLASRINLTWRQVGTVGFTLAGLVAQTIYMVLRYEEGVVPLSTLYEALLVLIWALALIYVVLDLEYRELALGAFLLPMIVTLVAAAAVLGEERTRELPDGMGRFWAMVHAALLTVGAFCVGVSFVAGLMYLVQVRRLKAKRLPGSGWKLPSLETLERVNRRGLVLGFPALTVGLLIGLVLVAAVKPGTSTWAALLDPKVISAIFTWVVLGAVVLLQREPRLRGRRVAYMTTIAFVLLMFTMVGVEVFLDTWHRARVGGLS